MPQRSAQRRSDRASSPPWYRNTRVLAVLTAVITCAALLTVQQVSSAAERNKRKPPALPPCPPATAAPADPGKTEPADKDKADDKGKAEQPADDKGRAEQPGQDDAAKDGDKADADKPQADKPAEQPSGADPAQDGAKGEDPNTVDKPPAGTDPNANPLPQPGQKSGTISMGKQGGVGHLGDGADDKGTARKDCKPAEEDDSNKFIGASCNDSKLPKHTGLQEGNKCVAADHGEVSDKNPSLIITKAPSRVRVGQPFSVTFSSKNLVRNNFFPAGQAGYYANMSHLDKNGIMRGHAHASCKMLSSTRRATDQAQPEFFLAVEDKKGGTRADSVTVNVTGMPRRGVAQCMVWAGDASHRPPMSTNARIFPAVDSVRIRVD